MMGSHGFLLTISFTRHYTKYYLFIKKVIFGQIFKKILYKYSLNFILILLFYGFLCPHR